MSGAMRYLIAMALFSQMVFADQTCVILKRASSADHTITGIEFYYVEGQYPTGYAFRTNLRGRHVRKIIKMGGRFVPVESKYSIADLEDARKQCAAKPVDSKP